MSEEGMTTLTRARAGRRAVRVPIPTVVSRPPAGDEPDEEYDEDTIRMQEWFIRHDRFTRWLSIGTVIAAAVWMACGCIPR